MLPVPEELPVVGVRAAGVPRVPTWAVPRRTAGLLAGESGLTLVWGPPGSGKSLLVAQHVQDSTDRAVVWVDVSLAPSARGVWEQLLAGLRAVGALAPAASGAAAPDQASAADRSAPPAVPGVPGAAAAPAVLASLAVPEVAVPDAPGPSHGLAPSDDPAALAPQPPVPPAPATPGPATLDPGEEDLDLAREVRTQVHAVRTPVTVVLDGYEAMRDARVDQSVVELVRDVARLRVVVVSRQEPRDMLAAAVLAVDVQTIGPSDLALDVAEVAAMLAGTPTGQDGRALPTCAEVAARVHEATHGLAVAVRAVTVAGAHGLLDLAAASSRDLAATAVRGTVAALGGTRSDEEFRRTALRTSVAEQLTPSLVAELAGAPAPDFLAQAERQGLGTWRSVGREVFEYTPVVRQALREVLVREAHDEVDGLLRTVTRWSLAGGERYTGLRAAVESGDLDLVEAVAARMWEGGELPVDRDAETAFLLEQLPPGEVATRPYLAFLLAISYSAVPEHLTRAAHWFEITADRCAALAPEVPEQYRAILRIGQSVSLRQISRAGEAYVAAQEALRLLAEAGDAIPATVRATSHRTLAISSWAVGRQDEAIDLIGASLRLTPPGSRADVGAHSLMAGFAAVDGDLTAAARFVQVAARAAVAERTLDDPYLRAGSVLARAHLALDAGEPDRAAEMLAGMSGSLVAHELWPAFAELGAWVDVVRGRPEAGEQVLVAAMRPGRRSPVPEHWTARLTASRALLALASGRVDHALTLLAGVPAEVPEVRLITARVLLSAGQVDDALGLLASPDLPHEGPRSRSARRLMLAATHARQGRTAFAGTALAEGGAIARDARVRLGALLLTEADRLALRAPARTGGLGPYGEDGGVAALLGLGAVLPDAVEPVGLSARELVVLRELAVGDDLQGVADRLYVSRNTLKTQVRAVYRKLGVGQRAQALTRARELGLLDALPAPPGSPGAPGGPVLPTTR
jgi:LuxR family transcriptional regulator, maltose regulon positive regulatory protein